MAAFDYIRYVELFNQGDDERLCNMFFTEDAIMQTSGLYIDGREALLAFLNNAHDGVREILHPQVVLSDDNHILVELNIEFQAYEDRPDFVIHPLKKGESVTSKFFAAYTLRDGRICHLKTAKWPPGYGV